MRASKGYTEKKMLLNQEHFFPKACISWIQINMLQNQQHIYWFLQYVSMNQQYACFCKEMLLIQQHFFLSERDLKMNLHLYMKESNLHRQKWFESFSHSVVGLEFIIILIIHPENSFFELKKHFFDIRSKKKFL